MRRFSAESGVVAAALWAWLVATRWDVIPHQHLTDLPVYENIATRVTDGDVPYRDFAVEYPPLTVLLVVTARVLPLTFGAAFSLLMFLALVATALGVMATARALGLGLGRQLGAGLVVATVPVLLGDFVATRFDLALSAVLAWTLWAAVTRRFTLAWMLLAAAVLLKLVPIVLAPLLLIWHRHVDGRRPAVRDACAAAGAVVAVFAPFLVASPTGVWALFRYHLERPLQIESMGAAYMLGLRALAGIPLQVQTAFGSQNLSGGGPDVIAAILTGLQVAVIIVVAVVAAGLLRSAAHRDGARIFVTAVAATLAGVVATGKVLSPQFTLWLLPACLLVVGRYGRQALVATIAVLAITQLYFPYRYWDLVALDTAPIALLVIRDVTLIVLLACCWPRRETTGDATPADSAG